MFFDDRRDDSYRIEIKKEQLSSVFDEYIPSERDICRCHAIIRNNKVVEMVLDVNSV